MSTAAAAVGLRAGRRWSKSEDGLLKRLYGDRLPVNQIAARMGRSPDAIVARRQALRIPSRRPRVWSTHEHALLRAATTAGLSASLLAERLGRSADQVRLRRRTLVGGRPRARPYLPAEDEAIRTCLTGHGDLTQLARRLGRSPGALHLRARHLGVHHPRPRRRWTDWEDGIVREGYTSGLPCAEIARQLPHRSPAGVSERARKLGLGSYARRWRDDEDRLLVMLIARGDSLGDLARQVGRTPEAIRRHSARLGIKPPPPMPAPRHGRPWTSEEDDLLRLHPAVNPARLAEVLGRSDVAVCRRLCILGLRARAKRSPHHPIGRRNGIPRFVGGT